MLLPEMWTAIDGIKVPVWLGTHHAYYPPILHKLAMFGFYIDEKLRDGACSKFSIDIKYYFGNYCGPFKILLRNSDEALKKYTERSLS